METDSNGKSPPDGDRPIAGRDVVAETELADREPAREAPPPLEPLSRRGSDRPREVPAWLSGIYAGVCLYFFVSAINVMGHGLKVLGKSSDFIPKLIV